MDDLISRAVAITKVEKARKAARTLTGMDFVLMLKDQPTVGAIPVEWLEAHSREYYEDWGEEPVTVENALAMWQKEQEAHNEPKV